MATVPRLKLSKMGRRPPPPPPPPDASSASTASTEPLPGDEDDAGSDSSADAMRDLVSPIRPATAGGTTRCPVGTEAHGPVYAWYKECVVLRCTTCAYAWHPRLRLRLCDKCEGVLRIESHYGELGYVCPTCRRHRKFEKLRKLVHDV